MPCQIFMDESGDICFSQTSTSKYFVIVCMVISEERRRSPKNTLRHKYSELYKLGWPKGIEIKAATLHAINHPANSHFASKLAKKINGDIYIKRILQGLTLACGPKVHCIAVNKNKITSKSLRSAEYGIAYNFFAKELLVPIIIEQKSCEVIIDQRSKETHPKKHFDDYIRTAVIGEAFNRGTEVQFSIEHLESYRVYGLQAVDYFCWAMNRYICRGENRYLRIFRDRLGIFKKWYC